MIKNKSNSRNRKCDGTGRGIKLRKTSGETEKGNMRNKVTGKKE